MRASALVVQGVYIKERVRVSAQRTSEPTSSIDPMGGQRWRVRMAVGWAGLAGGVGIGAWLVATAISRRHHGLSGSQHLADVVQLVLPLFAAGLIGISVLLIAVPVRGLGIQSRGHAGLLFACAFALLIAAGGVDGVIQRRWRITSDGSVVHATPVSTSSPSTTAQTAPQAAAGPATSPSSAVTALPVYAVHWLDSGCETDSVGIVHARGTITNNSGATHSYLIHVAETGSDGTRIDSSTDFVTDLPTGATGRWEALGDQKGYDGALECEIEQVEIL